LKVDDAASEPRSNETIARISPAPEYPAAGLLLDVAREDYGRARGTVDAAATKILGLLAALVALMLVLITALPGPHDSRWLQAGGSAALASDVIAVLVVLWALRPVTFNGLRRSVYDASNLRSAEDHVASNLAWWYAKQTKRVRSKVVPDIAKRFRFASVAVGAAASLTGAYLLLTVWAT
jgi:hypothetical protein